MESIVVNFDETPIPWNCHTNYLIIFPIKHPSMITCHGLSFILLRLNKILEVLITQNNLFLSSFDIYLVFDSTNIL